MSALRVESTVNRQRRVASSIAFVAMLLLACPALCFAEEPQFSPPQIEFFENKVRPLLAEHCYECHSERAKNLQGGLRLDGRALILAGGDSGPAVALGKPDESPLVEAVRWDSFEMPPKGKLSDDQVAVLIEWVEMNAPWPPETDTPQPDPLTTYDWQQLRDDHWAFRPVVKPPLPEVRQGDWPINEVDHFVLARLEQANLPPAPPAEARTLIRRIYFDLVGLPPTPEEVDAFVDAAGRDRQAAVERAVNRLLDSPQYGQRWARHWLDVARYSDGHGGFLDNAALPHAWRYRDWVVDALNADMPFEMFIKLQIAGDLLDEGAQPVATGFFALGPTYHSDGGDPDSEAQAKAETLADRIDTLGRGILGLTLACARCHEHKFDPVPQADYYSLAGVFNNTRVHEAKIVAPDKPEVAHVLADSGTADMHVAIRGDLRRTGDVAPRRFLRILAGEDPPPFTRGSGRLELAQAVSDPRNPLTARVFVNRVWLHHFGRALVRSPSNFGTLGEKPTHPELLDWLTATFTESGGSLKQLHRTIICSATYQMSVRFAQRCSQAAGDNRLLWRMNPRRLDVEAWRDALLAVTGELDLTSAGPPTDRLDSPRRTLYFRVSRNGDQFATDHFLRLFDFPMMRASVARRPTSIVPPSGIVTVVCRARTEVSGR